jgi:hypothetical protein
MKILITEDKRLMLIKTELKNLFNNLTPTRNGHTENIIYVNFDDIYNDEVKGLVYRPSNRQLIIYSDYFSNIRMFMSSEEEFGELITQEYQELTDKPVRYYEVVGEL